MHARAVLTVERGAGGRSVVRELRSQSPLSLVPRRGTAAAADPGVTVHMVGSASTPLAGDDVELDVHVRPGADLVLTGLAAAVALPGTDRPSSLTIRVGLDEGASLQYLPEPTVITARAHHRTLLHVQLHPTARLRAREVLVAGRAGEPSGRYRGTVRIEETGERPSRSPGMREGAVRATPLLHQTQELGDAALQDSAAHLAGRRVLGTEVLLWGEDGEAAAGSWWSLAPLAVRGSLATAVGPDAVSTQRALAEAVAAHPGWTAGTVHDSAVRAPGTHGSAVRAAGTRTEAP
ncbi:urease accessory protein UreD [Pseudonocardia halophobica]|uniref:Urease accessory protein UreD n=1 Tax=Pseudonocardia halophobica TaxID=29401 RepID=A0A9W6KZD1_9PSEU|nr:urease accessory protein UreD [Pseudonocardia halophobica]GLL09245.1 urease accessory protein UreD [Pseudonocardia halophobica]